MLEGGLKFDETFYLKNYPDVAKAVSLGIIPNGEWHYVKFGRAENRKIVTTPINFAWESFIQSAPSNPNLEDFSQFNELIDKLIRKEPFQIARYNDGEWVFILKMEPLYSKYIQRSNYPSIEIEEISNKMLKVIDSKPPYYIGIDSSTLDPAGSIKTHYDLLLKKITGLNIVYGEIFNAATTKYGMDALTKPLANRWVITVGPQYMTKLKLKTAHHISVPGKSCWTEAESVKRQLEKLLVNNLDKEPVVLYSCSLLAKWLIDEMFHRFNKITQMDIGSCIDPWCGIDSRDWHSEVAKQFKLDKLVKNPFVNYST